MSNSAFRSITPAELGDNFFSRIGEDWMLITAEADTPEGGGHVNAMTASWGAAGILWNKPVAICFIRPQRYTYEIVAHTDRLSLCFFPHGEERDALRYCGSKSGRDGDKLAATGLSSAYTASGVPYIAEANLVLICRKLYVDDLKASKFLDPSLLANYAAGDFHRMFVCEIEDVLGK